MSITSQEYRTLRQLDRRPIKYSLWSAYVREQFAVRRCLYALRQRGFAEPKYAGQSTTRWFITEAGRAALREREQK
ncbi:hypothetical protein [Brucella intermedia]|uniref:hypothetical protein n=1 Tax=Brucella intermedia TaxID=94625 RepID=UPI001589B3EC|nr:hypothetical protein [Brucella intermedia]NYD84411.1 hypothetical protein [Brucella intermedia]